MLILILIFMALIVQAQIAPHNVLILRSGISPNYLLQWQKYYKPV